MSQDKNSSEQPSRKKSSGSEVNLDSKNDKSEFLRPSRVRKTSLNDSLKSRKNKNSSSRSSLGKQLNTSNDESAGRTSEATKTPVSKYPCHDSFTSGNQTCKQAVQDSFITPKKQRRTSKLQNMSTSSSDKICTAAVKTTPRKSNTPGREFVKRNHLGETPLHVACIKGNVDRVRALLEASATPNTKDNAGWTPLHEASNHGHIEIVKLLLDAGALVNVPGAQNITPLHEAVSNNHLHIVKLLVAHGADINARSSQGKSPLEESSSLDISEALLKTEVVAKNPVSSSAAVKDNSTLMETVLFGEAGLTPEEKTQLAAAASKLKARVAAIFGVDVTHLVVPSDKQNTCPPSMDVLCAILQGTFILTREWLTSDISFDHEVYELSGVTDFADADAPKLSRLNAQKQLPGLFNGCHFYVTNNTHYKMTSCLLSKVNIITLIKRGGGIVLTRKPDPEAIPATEQTVPYHAPRNSTLSSTSHFIIYSPGKGEPELKYNMKHCKTLPIEWLIHCILNWQLIDP